MCDTLCARTRDGMLFAKNSDRHPAEVQVVESYAHRESARELRTQYLTIADADAFAFVGSRPTWLWGVEHGVNERQVAIGNEKIFTVDSPRDLPPALLGMDLVRLTLERAPDADAALDILTTLLERHGQGGSGEPHHDEPYFSSFLVADPRGGWVVETSGRTWVAQPAGTGTALSNRVCVRTEWTRASTDVPAGADFDAYRLPVVPTGRADHRLSQTRAVAARSDVTPALLARTLRSHGTAAQLPMDNPVDGRGYTVCMHRGDVDAQTTASMITELRTDRPARAWACLGNPCVSVYVPLFPPAVPVLLAEPATWHRFATLRDLVEATPDRLAEVQTELGTVEADLWAAADDAWESGRADRLTAFVAGAGAPLDAALLRLGV